MVLSCLKAMIRMFSRSSMCLPEHGNLPKCHILSSIIFDYTSDYSYYYKINGFKELLNCFFFEGPFLFNIPSR